MNDDLYLNRLKILEDKMLKFINYKESEKYGDSYKVFRNHEFDDFTLVETDSVFKLKYRGRYICDFDILDINTLLNKVNRSIKKEFFGEK